MASGDYNVVIDVDDEGDLGDLEFNQELEFHHSSELFPAIITVNHHAH